MPKSLSQLPQGECPLLFGEEDLPVVFVEVAGLTTGVVLPTDVSYWTAMVSVCTASGMGSWAAPPGIPFCLATCLRFKAVEILTTLDPAIPVQVVWLLWRLLYDLDEGQHLGLEKDRLRARSSIQVTSVALRTAMGLVSTANSLDQWAAPPLPIGEQAAARVKRATGVHVAGNRFTI